MLRQDDLILVAGPRRSGKSVLTKKITDAMPRLVVFDTMLEYAIEENDLVATNPRELAEQAKLILTHKPKNYRLLIQFGEDTEEIEDFSTCLKILTALKNLHIVIEELPEYTGAGWMPVPLRRLILTGRHYGIGITATTQRPAEIPKTFISNCAHLFLSRFEEPNDLKYFERILNKSVFNSLCNLKRFNFLHYERGGCARIVRA